MAKYTMSKLPYKVDDLAVLNPGSSWCLQSTQRRVVCGALRFGAYCLAISTHSFPHVATQHLSQYQPCSACAPFVPNEAGNGIGPVVQDAEQGWYMGIKGNMGITGNTASR